MSQVFFDDLGIPPRLLILFLVHPRTVKRIQEFGLDTRLAALPGLRVLYERPI